MINKIKKLFILFFTFMVISCEKQLPLECIEYFENMDKLTVVYKGFNRHSKENIKIISTLDETVKKHIRKRMDKKDKKYYCKNSNKQVLKNIARLNKLKEKSKEEIDEYWELYEADLGMTLADVQYYD